MKFRLPLTYLETTLNTSDTSCFCGLVSSNFSIFELTLESTGENTIEAFVSVYGLPDETPEIQVFITQAGAQTWGLIVTPIVPVPCEPETCSISEVEEPKQAECMI